MSIPTTPVNIAIGFYGHAIQRSDLNSFKELISSKIEEEDHVLVDLKSLKKSHELFDTLNLWTQPNSGVQVCLLFSDSFLDLDNGFSNNLNELFRVRFDGYQNLLAQICYPKLKSSVLHLNAKAGLVGTKLVFQIPLKVDITNLILDEIIFEQLRSTTAPLNLCSLI